MALTGGKTGCQSGKSSFFWKVAIYHLWGTFISLIPHYIMKTPKSNQFSGIFVAQNLFLSYYIGKSWVWKGKVGKMSFFWKCFQNMSKLSLFIKFYNPKHLYITKFQEIYVKFKFFCHKMWQKEHFLTIFLRGSGRGPLFQGAKTSDFGAQYFSFRNIPISENWYSS